MTLALSACSSEVERAPAVDPGGAGIPRVGPAGFRAEYPGGPYGRKNPRVGDVIEDLRFIGYRGAGEPITVRGAPDAFSLSDLRKEGSSHLLIHVASFWCAACRPEALYLSQYADELMAAGGEVLEILVDGDVIGDDPTTDQLSAWVVSNDLRITTVIPGDDYVREVFPDRDHVYIVDLETMEIIWRAEGPSTNPAVTEIAAIEMRESWLIK